ncbi:hypothetical protein QUF50_03595 [Thiotrichales bacterium HSG1]|nr:hypothetical protein [Thiotrichales bacterium HSG1]
MQIAIYKPHLLVVMIVLCSSTLSVFAFSDMYEPDNSPEKANAIFIGDITKEQHTLHQDGDEDWFLFEAKANDKDIHYTVAVTSVGEDIDVVVELYDADDIDKLLHTEGEYAPAGKTVSFPWAAKKDGFYYLKITDNPDTESVGCRDKIQYELLIYNEVAPEGTVKGNVIDAISGDKIYGAKMSSTCTGKYSVFSKKDGNYQLKFICPVGEDHEVTAIKAGYETAVFSLKSVEIATIKKDIQLLPSGKNIPPPELLILSESIYHNGDKLTVELPKIFDGYLDYYIGLQYPAPDDKLFIITKKTDELPAPYQGQLSKWESLGNIAIENMPITEDMPRGKYTLYLLRTPEGVDNPLDHLEELSVSSFEVK